MRRTIRRMIRLYPLSWRERYGPEFDALLEDVKPRGSDIADIAKEVVQMHITTWNPGKITVALAIFGTLVAGVTALRIPDTYLSTAVLKAGRSDSESVANMVRTAMTRGALTKIINDEHLYEAERAVKPLEEVVDKMRRAVQIKAGEGDFTVSFMYPDEAKTQHATGDLVRLLQQAASPTMALEVLELANSRGPVYPNRLTILAIGLVSGLLLGATIAGLLRMLPPRAA
jgi:capsular polysaccharide biosynthesis protein